MDKGKVIWITGLSGAGKTTLAKRITTVLCESGKQAVMLDGDQLREVFGTVTSSTKNHGREGRLSLALQYARLCRVLADQGLTVIIATISMFQEVFTWNRTHLPGYFEVYLKVPKEELWQRDPKGIYKRFHSGELKNVAGMDLAVDEPEDADLIINFEKDKPVATVAKELLNRLKTEDII